MKRSIEISNAEIGSADKTSRRSRPSKRDLATLWRYYLSPCEPPATASMAQRERARRGKIASIIVMMLLLSALSILPGALLSMHYTLAFGIGIAALISIVALALNRSGATEIAGILILALIYAAQAYAVLSYPGGLTLGRLSLLNFTVIPSIIALVFFPANSLFVVTTLDILVTWVIIMFTPHNETITNLLKTAPYQIFAQIYLLQIIISFALYLWARSSEDALRRADRAEELINLEKREKALQQQELERMRQFDAGIQTILQTHIAVANGDLNARAPLNQDHMLWQVALALNNLIGRVQRLTIAENMPKTDAQSVNELNQLLQQRSMQMSPKQTQKVNAIPKSIIPMHAKRF